MANSSLLSKAEVTLKKENETPGCELPKLFWSSNLIVSVLLDVYYQNTSAICSV